MLKGFDPRSGGVPPQAKALALTWALGLLLSAPIVAGAAEGSSSDGEMMVDLEGLWAGQILYAPAEIELDFWVELGRDADGMLVGNIDVPSQKMKFYPLSSVEHEGRRLDFDFHRDSEITKNAHFYFRGQLSEDGEAVTGTFKGWKDDDGRNRVPFELKKVSSGFGERPEPQLQPLASFTGPGAAVREAFNEDVDNVRLVILLSPT